MKGLTVKQPWAWAIVNGGKTVENRKQVWSYRGPLAIHAGRTWSDRGAVSDLVHHAWAQHGLNGGVQAGLLQRHWFPHSSVIGVVDLVDCHVADGCCGPWGESGEGRITHLVLENPRPVAPIPCSGALGLWSVPEYVMQCLSIAGVLS